MASQPSGSVAFVFTDIEGSTRRWLRDTAQMEVAVRDHDLIVRTVVDEHGGYIFSTAGDSFAIAFAEVGAALDAAASIQRSLGAHPWGELGALAVRVGVHIGTAQARDNDYFGPEVSRAARVMDAAHGGQVLVSRPAAVLAGDRPLLDLGPHHLRDIPDPEWLHQLLGEGLATDFPPPRSLEQARGSLPVQHSTFVGRAEELARLRDLISSHRLVTVTGTGGTGKTRLAVEAAALERDAFESTYFVDLGGTTEANQLLGALAAAIDARVDPTGPALAQALAHLARRRALVLLDNCEQLLDEVADVVLPMLESCPDVRVVTTSREPIGLDGEQVYRVPSLATSSDAGDLPPAIRLFLDRATAANPDLPVDAATQTAIAEVCERLDGIPLAIELAASRCRAMTPADLLDHLNDRFALLAGGRRRSRQRQATMEAAIDWSYRLLDDDEQRAFRGLSVFAGPFDLADAAAILDLPPGVALGFVDSLSAKSIISTDVRTGRARYRLLETLRAFGQMRLVEHDELRQARDRHLAHFLACLPPCDDVRAHTRRHLDWMVAHSDDLALAAEWGEGNGAGDALGALANGMFSLWLGHHRPAGTDLLDRALSLQMPDALRARVLYTRAIAAMVAFDLDAWFGCTAEALTMDLPPGLRALVRSHHVFPGVMAVPQDADAVISDALEALEAAGGDVLGEALCHMYRSMVRTSAFDPIGALADVAAVEARIDWDDPLPLVLGPTLGARLGSLLLLGRVDEAGDVARAPRPEGIGIWRTTHEVGAAVALAASGDHHEAVQRVAAEAQVIDPDAFPFGVDTLLTGFGLLAVHRGESERGRQLLDNAMGVRSPELFALLLDALAMLDGVEPGSRRDASMAERMRRASVSPGDPRLVELLARQPGLLAEELDRLSI